MFKKIVKCFVAIICLMDVTILLSSNLNSFYTNTTVGINPAGLAITPDGLHVYVANIGANTVSVVSTVTNSVVATISGFDQPYTLSINPAGTKAYVCNSNPTGANTVSVIDTTTNTITETISSGTDPNVFFGPSGMAITPDGLVGYVNNYGNPNGGNNPMVPGTTVSVVNLNTPAITATITVGDFPAAVAMRPAGDYVYVLNYTTGNVGEGTVSVIKVSDSSVVTIPGFWGPYHLAFNPAGTRAYVTNYGSNFTTSGNTVSVIDTDPTSGTFNTIIDTIVVGSQPSGIAINPAGTYAYVTLYSASTFKTIRLSDNTVVSPIFQLGSGPAEIIISPNGSRAYIVNYNDNTLETLSLSFFNFAGSGCKTENVFLTQKDLINKLTWQASGSSLPVRYGIYRDANLTKLIATIPATNDLFYFDHNRLPGVEYTYYIVGINAAGWSSFPVAVTVTQYC